MTLPPASVAVELNEANRAVKNITLQPKDV